MIFVDYDIWNFIIILEKASAKKLPTLKYITVGEVCKALGGKV